MKKLKIHPSADLLPQLLPAEYAELKADIKARGLREPILAKDGYIIDGRHRYRACQELGVLPVVGEYNGGGDIIDEIVSRNIFRRHLTADQRAALVAKMLGGRLSREAQARMKSGVANPTLKSAEGGETAEKIARKAKVGRDKARDAISVAKKAPADLDEVIAGKAKLSSLAKFKRKHAKRPRTFKTLHEKVEHYWVKFLEKFPVTQYDEVRAIIREEHVAK